MLKINFFPVFVLTLLTLNGCEPIEKLQISMESIKTDLEKIVTEKCKVKVFISMNARGALNGEQRVDNIGINFFSKIPPRCTDDEVKDKVNKYIRKNQINNDVNIVIFPWKK